MSVYLLIMELRFDTMLYFNLGNQNSDAGHAKCSRGLHFVPRPQVPHPCFRISVRIESSTKHNEKVTNMVKKQAGSF